MLTRRIRIQVLAFIVIALVGVSYLSVRYVGLERLVGANGYTVHLELADSGGIFSNAEVTYRGVPVGRVGAMRLTATGIQVDLNITSSRHIPSDLTAVVADRSAIGEQYVDLRPNNDNAPYLGDGTVIAQSKTALPPPIGQLLENVDNLTASIPTAPLNTVINEFSTAVSGSSTDLQKLIDSANQFFQQANAEFPAQAQLIDTSKTVLATQQQEAASIRSFSANLALLAGQLRASDPDLRRLITTVPTAAEQFTGLINDVGSSAGLLIGNLLTTSQVFLGNVNGVRELLVKFPAAVSVGSSAITADGIHVGLALTFFDPLPCTNGYAGTTRRTASDTSAGQPLNTAAGCTDPTTGSEVRGSVAAQASVSGAPGNSADTASSNSTSTLAGLMGLGG